MKNLLALTVLSGLLILSSCTDGEEKRGEVSNSKVPLRAADGTELSYKISGSGDSSLIFIHGWNIDQSYWDQQVNYFAPHYRVLTITLPGYGGTKAHPAGCGANDYAEDVALLMDSLSLAPAILIGHSMSGAIIAATAAIRPKQTAGIIGIDNFPGYGYQPTAEEKKAYAAVYEKMRKNYHREIGQYANQYLFSASTDSASRQRILNSFFTADSLFSVDCLEKMESYPLDSVLLSLHRPIYLVNSDFHPNDTASFRKAGIELHFYNVGTTGHYPMIEAPERFNSLLAEAIHDISLSEKTGD